MADEKPPFDYAEMGRTDGKMWLASTPDGDVKEALRGARMLRGLDGRKWVGRQYAEGFLEVANASKP